MFLVGADNVSAQDACCPQGWLPSTRAVAFFMRPLWLSRGLVVAWNCSILSVIFPWPSSSTLGKSLEQSFSFLLWTSGEFEGWSRKCIEEREKMTIPASGYIA